MRRREFLSLGAASLFLLSPLGGCQIYSDRSNRVAIDPRIELMSIVHLLGGYSLNSDADTAYKRDAVAYFQGYRSHPVVAMTKELADGAFAFDAVPDLLLRLTNPNELGWRGDLQDDVPFGIPETDKREEFVSLLRGFAEVSGFGDFFDQNRRFYREIAQSIEPLVLPAVDALEGYAGASLGEWRVIPGLLMFDGGFGPKLHRTDGTFETYALIGPLFNSTETPDFGDYNRLQNLVVHELAHSLINPLSEKHAELVQKYAERFDSSLRKSMLKQGAYDNWETVVNEHIIRAITTRIAKSTRGDAAGALTFADEVSRGYIYVPALIERLNIYEANRTKWPDLDSYYPELLRAFETQIQDTASGETP